jgi:hypothetical protein
MKKILSTLCLAAVLAAGAMGGPAGAQQSNPSDKQSDQSVKSDGSVVIITTASDGTKTEVRTFKTGDIARITRTTRDNGERAVMVEYRDGRTAKLEDESDIEQAMDATADAIKRAADKTWNVTKEAAAEVADKAEDVGDKAAGVGEKVVSKTKDAGKEVADKTEDVADKTVDTGKKAGKVAVKGVKVAADKTEDVADKAVDVGKEVGDRQRFKGRCARRGRKD